MNLQRPSWTTLRTCPLPLCTHRQQHRQLAIVFHNDCYELLLLALKTTPYLASMDNIWKFGRSTLWASVSDPAGQMKKRRITSLTSGFSAGIFLQCLIAEPKFVGRSILENPTSNLYRLSHALPLELLQVIIDLAWECSFFSAAAVFQQSRYFSSLRECLSTSISLLPSEPVFLGHLTYGDFRYISYISNERRALSDEQIFRASMTSQLKLAIDDIGIRRICFIEDNKDCTVHEHRCASTDEVVYRSLQTCDHGPLQRIFSSTDV